MNHYDYKMKTSVVLVIIAFMTCSSLEAQEFLILSHCKNPQKTKSLRLDKIYNFKTKDSLYYRNHIVAISDSTIQLEQQWTKERTELRLLNIERIQRNWYKNRDWAHPFGWMAIVGVIGIVGLPVSAIVDGKDGLKEWAITEALIFAISLPPILISEGRTGYDLVDKWKPNAIKNRTHSNKR